jgi:hypothetical protein
MIARLNVAATRPVHTIAMAAVATVISLGILWSIATLFQSRGAPLERLAAAERVCANLAYASEREACMKQWMNETRQTRVAGGR